MNPEELLIEISEILHNLEIPYIVTGGFAVSVWGMPRYTADIDIVIELLERNIKPLVKKLLNIDKNVYADEDMIRQALKYHSSFNLIHPETGLRVDFFVRGRNSYDTLKIKRAVLRDVFGHKIYFTSPEDLIISKLLWAKESESFKQYSDIKTILENDSLNLDMEYIKKWAEKQDTLEILEKLIKKTQKEK